MINGIWKNIIYPEKFYTLSIPMPASEDLQSEVILLNQLIKLEKKEDKCFGNSTSSLSFNQKLQISCQVLAENSCVEFHLIFKISLE